MSFSIPMERFLYAVNPAQPKEQLWQSICRWARTLGRPVYSKEDLRSIQSECARAGSAALSVVATDIELAFEVMAALERAPLGGFEAYASAWESRVIADRVLARGEYARLRELHGQFGGILIPSRALPFVLVIPLADGTWIQMGWETLINLDRSPLTSPQETIRVIAERNCPAGEFPRRQA